MKSIFLLSALVFVFNLYSCAHKVTAQQEVPTSQEREIATDKVSDDKIEPLLWENPKKDKNGNIFESNANFQKRLPRMKLWTAKLYELIPKETTLLGPNIPTDIAEFCPNYPQLGPRQRTNFWAQLISAISYVESEWSPTCRMVETTMGTDRITGKQIASEGLMQLSYQDVATYKQLFDCGFNWKVDRDLASNDPQKTIFAPYRNLRCGLLILNQKIKINNEISTPKTYWSVLRPAETNKYSKVSWLARQTQSLSFCRKPSSKN